MTLLAQVVLNFMVGGGAEDVPREVIEILQYSELMSKYISSNIITWKYNYSFYSFPMHDSEGIYSSITTTGFQFLLMDRQSQVWYFLLQYLKSVEASLVASSKGFRVFSRGGGGRGESSPP